MTQSPRRQCATSGPALGSFLSLQAAFAPSSLVAANAPLGTGPSHPQVLSREGAAHRTEVGFLSPPLLAPPPGLLVVRSLNHQQSGPSWDNKIKE
jgi:hypothetical protein